MIGQAKPRDNARGRAQVHELKNHKHKSHRGTNISRHITTTIIMSDMGSDSQGLAVENSLSKILVEIAYTQVRTADAILDIINAKIQHGIQEDNLAAVIAHSETRTVMLQIRQFLVDWSVQRYEERVEFLQKNQDKF